MDNNEMTGCLIGDVLADHAITMIKQADEVVVRVALAQTMIDKLARLMGLEVTK